MSKGVGANGPESIEVLDSDLLDVGLDDSVREPSWSVRWLVDFLPPSIEHVHSLGASLSKSDVSVSSRCGLQRCTSGLLARKDVVRILAALLQDEVFLVAHFGFLRCVNFRSEYNRFRNEALISAPCGPFCRRRCPIIDPDQHRQGFVCRPHHPSFASARPQCERCPPASPVRCVRSGHGHRTAT